MSSPSVQVGAGDGGVTDADVAALAEGRADWDTWSGLVDELGEHAAMELVFVVGT